MNLLKLAPALEQFAAAASEAAVTLDSDRCVRHWNQGNNCHHCAAGCPTAAITLAPGGVEYNADACVACGFCLHACPTGAFAGSDETAKLLQSAAAVTPCSALDLACGCFPTDQGGQGVDAIMQVSGCLAALGAAAYVGLAALGASRLGIHIEACAGCPIGALRTQIERVAVEAAQLGGIEVCIYSSAPAGNARKPVHRTRSPQYSRRGLLQRMMGAAPAAKRGLPPLEEPAPSQKSPPLARRTLLHVLAYLPDEQRMPAAYFSQFDVGPSCTACGVCATVCPTGALSFEPEDDGFSLRLAPLACTNCGLCTELCAPRALQPAAAVPYAEAGPAVLISGSLKKCQRCRAVFAGAGELCPACSFRRRNPAGSLLRPTP
jgi:energy-converting hydrogenase A subunit P